MSTSPSLPLAVQLYTVRDLVQADMAAALGQIGKMGYSGVELAGYGNLREPVAVKKAVHDAGLTIAAAHVGIEAMEAELDRVLDENEILGNRTLVIPWMPEERRSDADGWKQCARACTQIGRSCAKRGFTLCYHHHSFEFARFKPRGAASDLSGMEIFWQNSDPKFVKAELDTYWLAHGNEDPVAYIKQLDSRVELLHLKDMAKGEDRKFAEVGRGILNFKAILSAATDARVKWGIVEQDDCYTTPPMDALRTSFQNLRELLA